VSDKKYNILGIGNAIVDLLAHVDDSFLDEHQLEKGVTQTIERDAADRLSKIVDVVDCESGGSAANTIVGAASLGVKTAFIGKVNNDGFGHIFEEGLVKRGVDCYAKKVDGEESTARSVILVTPDAQRTMNTYLGIAGHLDPEDVDEAVVRDSEIVYFEGYLWDKESAKDAFRKAIEITKQSGGKISVTLSDSFCVDRHRDGFMDLAKNHVDILFSNETEILSLFQTESLDSAIDECKKLGNITVITLGEKGSLVIWDNDAHIVGAAPVSNVIDTTGAGDLFAAGFLSGFVNKQELPVCAEMGGIAAAEIISHLGARPRADLRKLMSEKGIKV